MVGGVGGCLPPPPATTGLVIKSVTTSPTLAGERMLFIPKVSILSEQKVQYLEMITVHTNVNCGSQVCRG